MQVEIWISLKEGMVGCLTLFLFFLLFVYVFVCLRSAGSFSHCHGVVCSLKSWGYKDHMFFHAFKNLCRVLWKLFEHKADNAQTSPEGPSKC